MCVEMAVSDTSAREKCLCFAHFLGRELLHFTDCSSVRMSTFCGWRKKWTGSTHSRAHVDISCVGANCATVPERFEFAPSVYPRFFLKQEFIDSGENDSSDN